MKPMSEEARALIEAARDLEAPPAGARSALRSSLDAKIAAGVAATIGAGTAAKGTAIGAAHGTAMGAAGASVSAKIVIGALVVGLGTVGVGTAVRHHVAVSRPAVLTAPRNVPGPVIAVEPPAETPESAPRTSGPHAIITPPPRAPAGREPSCGLAQEVKVLEQAEQDLQAHRPEQVIAQLDRASMACPGEGLGEERLALRVLALCALGRKEEARIVTERLKREAPQSPSLGRIRDECR